MPGRGTARTRDSLTGHPGLFREDPKSETPNFVARAMPAFLGVSDSRTLKSCTFADPRLWAFCDCYSKRYGEPVSLWGLGFAVSALALAHGRQGSGLGFQVEGLLLPRTRDKACKISGIALPALKTVR